MKLFQNIISDMTLRWNHVLHYLIHSWYWFIVRCESSAFFVFVFLLNWLQRIFSWEYKAGVTFLCFPLSDAQSSYDTQACLSLRMQNYRNISLLYAWLRSYTKYTFERKYVLSIAPAFPLKTYSPQAEDTGFWNLKVNLGWWRWCCVCTAGNSVWPVKAQAVAATASWRESETLSDGAQLRLAQHQLRQVSLWETSCLSAPAPPPQADP